MASTTQVAIAIIHHHHHFLMQLRDNIPTIAYPGLWGLFGGHMEEGETPEEAIRREILEEINYVVPENLIKFGIYADDRITRHVFVMDLNVPIEELTLHEGWDFRLLSSPEIESGQAYSENAKEVRSLGPIHRQIILDFLTTQFKSLGKNTEVIS